jgi:hypothetical protein
MISIRQANPSRFTGAARVKEPPPDWCRCGGFAVDQAVSDDYVDYPGGDPAEVEVLPRGPAVSVAVVRTLPEQRARDGGYTDARTLPLRGATPGERIDAGRVPAAGTRAWLTFQPGDGLSRVVGDEVGPSR